MNQNQQKSFFTDEEYRILLSALGRERKVCEQLDAKDKVLLRIMDSIESKIQRIQYPEKNHNYTMLELGEKHECINDYKRGRTLITQKIGERNKVCLYPIIFDWRGFEQQDFASCAAKIKSGNIHSGEYLGCVRFGNIKCDLTAADISTFANLKDDGVHLCIQLYVGGVNSGYAYGRNKYPYDRVDDTEFVFENEIPTFRYTEFQNMVEEKIVDLLKNSKYNKADPVEKATESLRVW